ncbi:hypothetical protein NQ315_005926 [Exocentrus adspersus]|uniref:Uncharacterized protein n=1 Tax=Exocentrus adspersus TaxID=1586481 RepID=A0AAV8VE84_9CUCU|nr:hypothetical protein NQ315_005926 [Exocentrus adspersus]
MEQNIESDSDTELQLTPPHVKEAAKLSTLNLLPKRSNVVYQRAYSNFMDWKKDKNAKTFSENVLLAYFGDLAKKFKSPTLWTQYSMLRTTLSLNDNIDIGKYFKLKAFLKRQSDGYKSKKSKNFSSDDIDKFIKQAPDEIYLVTKVAYHGRHELYQTKITNFNDLGSAILITIPDTKTKLVRSFTVTGDYYDIFKKYSNLRPPNVNDPWFFINYQKGKCTVQRIGLNKLGAMGKEIADDFCRSSATILVDAGAITGDITALKRHGAVVGNQQQSRRVFHQLAKPYIFENYFNTVFQQTTTGLSNNYYLG